MFASGVILVLLAAIPPGSPNGRVWLEQARQALEQGRFDAARQAARRIQAQEPGSADAELILGLADTGEARLSSAEQHFSKAASLQPSNYRTHTYLGSTYLRQQRLPEAKHAFQRVLELDPSNATAHYNLGVIAMLERNPSAALPHFTAAHKTQPGDPAALLALLECQLDLKQSRAARDSAQKLNAILPSNSPALPQIGAALASGGEYTAAMPFFRRYAAANPGSHDAQYNLALALLRTDALEESAAVLRGLVRGTAKAEAWNLLGTVEEKRGKQEDALKCLQQAAQLAPANPEFQSDYGAALVNAGHFDQAVAAFSQAIQVAPDVSRFRLGLGSVLYLSGKYEEAAQALLASARIDPKSERVYDLLGKSFESAPSQQPEILRLFEAYLRSGARDAVAEMHYGTMLYQKAEGSGPERFQPALQHLRRALELNPRLAEAHLQIGIVSQAAGDLPAAAASYQRAASLAPSSATIHYRLGTAYQKLGDASKAQSELELFRKLKQIEAAQEKQAVVRSLSGRN